MNIKKTLLKLRLHIMWIYIAIVIILLTAPLPLEEGYGTGKTASVSHFLMFFLLGIVVEFAYLFSFDIKRVAELIVFAIIMETIQLALPYRVFDFADMGMNVIGIIISYLIIVTTHGSLHKAHGQN